MPDWWRKWAGTIALGAVVAATATGFFQTEAALNQIASEAQLREQQFCQVLLGGHSDKVERLRHTVSFLSSPAGHQPTALNIYIRRISLPQTRAEVSKEQLSIPDTCWQYQPPPQP